MKLKFQLVSSFLGVLSLVVISGIVNIQAQKSVIDKVSRLSEDVTPKLLILEEIKVDSLKMTLEVSLHSLLQIKIVEIAAMPLDRKAQDEYVLEFKAAQKNLEKGWQKLEVMSATPEAKKTLKKIENAKSELYQTGQKLINFQYKSGTIQNILSQKNDLEEAEDKFIEIIDEAIQRESQALAEAKDKANKSAGNAIVINSISIIAVVLLACIIGLILANRIVKPIEKIKEAFVKIGQGNLDVKLKITSNDELRILADAFNQMAENLNRKTVSKSYVDNILRSMIDALIILNYDGSIKSFNLAAFLLLRYDDEEELIGKPMKILFGDELFLNELENDRTTQNSFLGRKETTLLAKDGSKIPVYFSASVMRDPDGQIQGFVCLAQDITQSKRAEAARSESEAKWRSLVENAPDIIMTASAIGKIQFVNRVMPGLTVEQLIGSSVYEYVPPESREQLRNILERVITTSESQSYEMGHLEPDGSISWYATRVSPIFNNREVVAVTMITTNISDRKRMEEALRESEERLENILNSLNDVVWSVAADTFDPLYLNPAIETVYGRGASEFFNNPKLWFEVVHPEDSDRLGQRIQILLTTGRLESEYRIIRPDGEVLWLNDRSRLTRATDGTPIRLDGITTDITARKRAEEALVHANEDLEIRVQERTKALRQTNKRLQQEIAKRQRVAEALRQNKERLNGILNSLDDVVWSASTSTYELLYISPAAQKIYGHSAIEFFKNTQLWWQLLHPEDRDRVKNQQQQSLVETADTADMEYRIVRPSGEVRWLRDRYRLVCDIDGTPIRLDGIATDITDRKRAEMALQRSEMRFRKLAKREALLNRLGSQIRNSLDINTILETAVVEIRNLLQIDRCLFIWYRPNARSTTESASSNQTSLITQYSSNWQVVKEARNPALPSLLGYYPVNPETPLMAKLLNREMIRADDLSVAGDRDMQDLHSIWGFASIAIVPIQTLAGEIGLLVCGHCSSPRPWRNSEVTLLQAINDQVAIALFQAELYTHATEAAIAAKEQAQQLQQAMKALQQTQAQLIQTEKMSSLGQMIAGIAHEINNPLSFIFGNVDPALQYIHDLLNLLHLYQQQYPPNQTIQDEIDAIDLDFLAEDLPKLLLSMQNGAERIRQIILSLRNFSRLDEAQMKAVDIHSGLQSTLLILQNRLKAKGSRPDIEAIEEYDSLPQVECFAGQLNQVFMNILNNAIDAIEESFDNNPSSNNKVKSDRRGQIRIRTRLLDPHRVEIRIADNGPGINHQIEQRIFDPFFTTKPVGAGTGLGLSISYQIVVEKHKGKLSYISTPGQGTEFIIELTVQQQYVEPALFK